MLKIENLHAGVEGQDILNQYITPDYTEAVVEGVVSSTDTKIMHRIIDNINAYLKEKHYDNMKVTGLPVIYTRLDESLVDSQKKSLVISIILVFLLVSLMLKGFRQGFSAIIPIIVTLVVLFGSMGILGIPLDVATVLVGSVSIGIGIDYAIHFSNGLTKNTKTLPLNGAINETMKVTGKGIIINMLSVMLGFLVMVFAELVPLQYFGILVAITMLTSSLSTLTILPVLKTLNHKPKKS
jgi:predicted RND superfamily exporter protein